MKKWQIITHFSNLLLCSGIAAAVVITTLSVFGFKPYFATSQFRVLDGIYLVNSSGDTVGQFRGDGYIQRKKMQWYDAIALFPNGGATLDTLNGREEVYNFAGVDDSLWGKWKLPYWFTQEDTIKLWVSTDSTSGDSIAYAVGLTNTIDKDETVNSGIASTVRDTIDLGTQNGRKRELSFTGFSLSNSQGGGVVFIKITVDTSIVNAQAGVTHLHDIEVLFK